MKKFFIIILFTNLFCANINIHFSNAHYNVFRQLNMREMSWNARGNIFCSRNMRGVARGVARGAARVRAITTIIARHTFCAHRISQCVWKIVLAHYSISSHWLTIPYIIKVRRCIMYASSNGNIVMIMFFELFLPRKISEFPSGTRTHNIQISHRRSEGCGFESRLGTQIFVRVKIARKTSS